MGHRPDPSTGVGHKVERQRTTARFTGDQEHDDVGKEPPRPYRVVVDGTSLNVKCDFLAVAIRAAKMLTQSEARTA